MTANTVWIKDDSLLWDLSRKNKRLTDEQRDELDKFVRFEMGKLVGRYDIGDFQLSWWRTRNVSGGIDFSAEIPEEEKQSLKDRLEDEFLKNPEALEDCKRSTLLPGSSGVKEKSDEGGD